MEAPASTTLVVVGDEATSAIHALERYANVRAATFDDAPDDVVTRWSASAAEPYVVHDHDPLGHVANAWVEFFDDQSTYGVLELEIDRALDAAERHAISVPDYYVVLQPENLPVTWRHWWLGVLAADPRHARITEAVEAVTAVMRDRTGAHPNVDLALGALTVACGMRDDAGEVLFATARAVGWLVHALDEYAQPPLRLRPVGRYVGD